MKKLLFAAVDMNVGGIETALLTLLNYLSNKDYKITLVLEKKQGIFLKNLDTKIKVIEYKPSESGNFFLRKIINLSKRVMFTMKYKNRYDFSASFATYSKMSSFVARTASSNNILWGHIDYLEYYRNDREKVKEFFEGLHYDRFNKIIFVSEKACETFIDVYPNMKDRVVFCNNIIDYNKIQKLAEETVEEEKDTYIFANIGRHDERQKKLTRIIDAAKLLKEDNIKFKILFIGEGPDTKLYKDLTKEHKLEENIKFLGVKKNPYPYMKLADTIILSSDYEGYPVVFVEALILNKPIITTDVSDAIKDIKDKYGKVVDKNVESIYLAMKEFIENGYRINERFNPEQYNQEVIKILEELINC